MPRSRKTEIVISRPATARPLVVVSPTTLVTRPRSTPGKKRRNRKSRPNRAGSSLSLPTRAYINTLRNPFEFPGIRLGWGTFTPTNLYTAYKRFSFAAHTDGSFGVSLMPFIGSPTSSNIWPIKVNNTGLGTGWASSFSFQDADYIHLASEGARIVSGGIKVLPLVPATNSPGVIYAGSLPGVSTNDVITNSLTTLVTSPLLNMGYGATGASAMILPLDPRSFEIADDTLGYFGASSKLVSTVPIIIGTGFAASTVVVVEVMMNVECTPNVLQNQTLMNSPDLRNDDTSPTLVGSFSSIESMWNTVKQYMPESASVNSASTVLSSVGTMATRLARAHRTFRNAFATNPHQNILSDLAVLD